MCTYTCTCMGRSRNKCFITPLSFHILLKKVFAAIVFGMMNIYKEYIKNEKFWPLLKFLPITKKNVKSLIYLWWDTNRAGPTVRPLGELGDRLGRSSQGRQKMQLRKRKAPKKSKSHAPHSRSYRRGGMGRRVGRGGKSRFCLGPRSS